MTFKIQGETTLVSVNKISTAEIPSNVVTISQGNETNYVFHPAKDTLTKVSCEDGSKLTTIGSYAFYSCTRLEIVDFSKCTQLVTINQWAFALCYSLQTFKLCSPVKIIESTEEIVPQKVTQDKKKRKNRHKRSKRVEVFPVPQNEQKALEEIPKKHISSKRASKQSSQNSKSYDIFMLL